MGLQDLSPANTVEIYWLEAIAADLYERHLILSRPNSTASWGLQGFDVDADGDLDLLVVDSREDSIYWFENEGAGHPAFVQSHVIEPNYQDISSPRQVSDIDDDGDQDIVLFLDGVDQELRWYENLGDGSYVTHFLGFFPDDRDNGIAVGDFSADGRLDIAFGGGVRWLENQGGSPLSFAEHPPTATETRNFVVPGDMDLDGRIDLMGAPAGALLWQENVIGLRLSASGLAVQGYLCRNRSSGQTVRVESAATTVDCEVEGLVVAPGDEIEVFARGMAE